MLVLLSLELNPEHVAVCCSKQTHSLGFCVHCCLHSNFNLKALSCLISKEERTCFISRTIIVSSTNDSLMAIVQRGRYFALSSRPRRIECRAIYSLSRRIMFSRRFLVSCFLGRQFSSSLDSHHLPSSELLSSK